MSVVSAFLTDLVAAILDPRVAAMLLVVLVAGTTRGFAGFGAGMIYVPVAAAVFGPEVAAATVLLYDIPASVPFTIRLLPRADVRQVLPLAAGAALATPLGYLALTRLDPPTVRWAISALVLAGLVAIMAGVRFRRGDAGAAAVGVGAVSGFMNGLAQVGGPPVILYWLGLAMEPATVRASSLLYFQFGTAVTLATYLAGGLLTREVLVLSAAMAPVFAAGMILGARMFPLADARTYRRIAYALIAASATVGLPIWSG